MFDNGKKRIENVLGIQLDDITLLTLCMDWKEFSSNPEEYAYCKDMVLIYLKQKCKLNI